MDNVLEALSRSQFHRFPWNLLDFCLSEEFLWTWWTYVVGSANLLKPPKKGVFSTKTYFYLLLTNFLSTFQISRRPTCDLLLTNFKFSGFVLSFSSKTYDRNVQKVDGIMTESPGNLYQFPRGSSEPDGLTTETSQKLMGCLVTINFHGACCISGHPFLGILRGWDFVSFLQGDDKFWLMNKETNEKIGRHTRECTRVGYSSYLFGESILGPYFPLITFLFLLKKKPRAREVIMHNGII